MELDGVRKRERTETALNGNGGFKKSKPGSLSFINACFGPFSFPLLAFSTSLVLSHFSGWVAFHLLVGGMWMLTTICLVQMKRKCISLLISSSSFIG